MSVSEKLQVIERLRSGESRAKVASDFNIGRTTVFDILQSEEKILKSASVKLDSPNTSVSLFRKKACVDLDILENELHKWYMDKSSDGVILSGQALSRKSQELSTKLGIAEFEPTRGWLQRFKKKFDIVTKRSGDDVQIAPKCSISSDPCHGTKDDNFVQFKSQKRKFIKMKLK